MLCFYDYNFFFVYGINVAAKSGFNLSTVDHLKRKSSDFIFMESREEPKNKYKK